MPAPCVLQSDKQRCFCDPEVRLITKAPSDGGLVAVCHVPLCRKPSSNLRKVMYTRRFVLSPMS
eukprot:12676397-Prorocentrum_lima.AAC.1